MRAILLLALITMFSLPDGARAESKRKPATKTATNTNSAAKATKSNGFSAVCKSMQPADWTKNFNGCLQAFSPGVKDGRVTLAVSQQICRCVADNFVKKSTCSEIDRFKRDKAYERQVAGRLAKVCVPVAQRAKGGG